MVSSPSIGKVAPSRGPDMATSRAFIRFRIIPDNRLRRTAASASGIGNLFAAVRSLTVAARLSRGNWKLSQSTRLNCAATVRSREILGANGHGQAEAPAPPRQLKQLQRRGGTGASA